MIDRLWLVGIHLLMFAFLILTASQAHATSRIKDIGQFQGVRENTLVGYGLVTGLLNTGDDLTKIAPTKETLLGTLERLGVNVRADQLLTQNAATVMVTATLPPFSRKGSMIDVTVSSLGNATSLRGGVLVETPLIAADGEVYAVAQGPLEVGGFSAQGQGASVVRGVPTSGRVPSGAIVEREVDFKLAELKTLKMALRNPDLTTARRVADAINAYLGTTAATEEDSGTVQIQVPDGYQGSTVDLLAKIEQLPVEPDQAARVIIDENTGVVVISDDVRVSTVAIAQANLTIRITETPQVSQPAPFSQTGTTVVVPRTDIQVDEGKDKRLGIVSQGVSLQELVNGLNSLGVGPRDMISILQAIKADGALQADLQVM
jgi:flagellar P-ring protein precursor FlgI